jgi:hypothetical protein
VEWPGYDEEVRKFTKRARLLLDGADHLLIAHTDLTTAMGSEKASISDIQDEL